MKGADDDRGSFIPVAVEATSLKDEEEEQGDLLQLQQQGDVAPPLPPNCRHFSCCCVTLRHGASVLLGFAVALLVVEVLLGRLSPSTINTLVGAPSPSPPLTFVRNPDLRLEFVADYVEVEQYARLSHAPGGGPQSQLFSLIRPYHFPTPELNLTCALVYHSKPANLSLTDRAIVALDGRENEPLTLVLRHTSYLLGPEWGMVLFVTPALRAFYEAKLDIREGGWGEHIQLHLVSQIAYQQANDLPGSAVFYEAIPTPHLVIVQDDGFPIRSTYLPGVGTSSIWSDDWMHRYVFLGAPWIWCNSGQSDWCRYAGNGGASYRRKAVMLELVKNDELIDCVTDDRHRCAVASNYAAGRGYEDTFISQALYDRRPRYDSVCLTDQAEMARFSVETRDVPQGEHPFFLHKTWAYLGIERSGQHLAYALQYYPAVDPLTAAQLSC